MNYTWQASLLSEKRCLQTSAKRRIELAGKVRSLDEGDAKKSAKSAERVGQVMELKVIYLYVWIR